MLLFLTLLCMPNVVGGAQPERDLSETAWGKDSAEARSLFFPGTHIMEPACESIVGYLRNLWEQLRAGTPIEEQEENVKSLFHAISNLRVTLGDLQPSTPPYNFVRPHTGDMGDLLTKILARLAMANRSRLGPVPTADKEYLRLLWLRPHQGIEVACLVALAYLLKLKLNIHIIIERTS